MTPPINIDGSKIAGGTIDGTDFLEVTVDGTTVFSAIPDSGIYLDDFADGKTQNRDDFVTTEYTSQLVGVINNSAFSNPVRPEWDSNEAVTDGVLQPNHDLTVSNPVSPSNFWSEDLYFRWIVAAESANDRGDWEIVRENSDNRWQFRLKNGEIDIVKRVSGNFSTILGPVSLSDDTAFNRFELTYSQSNDEWELSVNGGSIGTATDSFEPDPNETRLSDGSGNGSLKVEDLTIA